MKLLSSTIGVILIFLFALFAAEWALSMLLPTDASEVIRHGLAIAAAMLVACAWVWWIAGRRARR